MCRCHSAFNASAGCYDGRGGAVTRIRWAKTRSLELSKGSLCSAVRAEREHGNASLPTSAKGSFRAMFRAEHGGGKDE
eukprot:1885274-Alexandrium_andersonii.AAC.1